MSEKRELEMSHELHHEYFSCRQIHLGNLNSLINSGKHGLNFTFHEQQSQNSNSIFFISMTPNALPILCVDLEFGDKKYCGSCKCYLKNQRQVQNSTLNRNRVFNRSFIVYHPTIKF